MEPKKNPKVAVESKRHMIRAFSFCLSISFVLVAFEWRTTQEPIFVLDEPESDFEPVLEIQQTVQPPPEPPKPKIQPIIKESKVVIEEPDVDLSLFDQVDEPIIELPEIDIEEPEEPVEPFIIVEKMPQPIGGMTAFYKFMAKNLKYPKAAQRMGIEGKVFIEFIVETDGTLRDVKVMKGIQAGCDEAAVEVIKAYPGWEPGKQRGRAVPVRMVMPIYFKLNH